MKYSKTEADFIISAHQNEIESLEKEKVQLKMDHIDAHASVRDAYNQILVALEDKIQRQKDTIEHVRKNIGSDNLIKLRNLWAELSAEEQDKFINEELELNIA